MQQLPPTGCLHQLGCFQRYRAIRKTCQNNPERKAPMPRRNPPRGLILYGVVLFVLMTLPLHYLAHWPWRYTLPSTALWSIAACTISYFSAKNRKRHPPSQQPH